MEISFKLSIGGVHCKADQDLVMKALKLFPNAVIEFRMRNSEFDPRLVIVDGIDDARLAELKPALEAALDNGICRHPPQIVLQRHLPSPIPATPLQAYAPLG